MWWTKPNIRFCIDLQTGYLMSQKRTELEESTLPLTVVPVRSAPIHTSQYGVNILILFCVPAP